RHALASVDLPQTVDRPAISTRSERQDRQHIGWNQVLMPEAAVLPQNALKYKNADRAQRDDDPRSQADSAQKQQHYRRHLERGQTRWTAEKPVEAERQFVEGFHHTHVQVIVERE